MKKLLFALIPLVMIAATANAQKYAIIDTRYILDKMPDYKTAQKQLDDVAADWQKDIDSKQADLDKMYKAFESEQVMLSDDLKKKEKTSFLIRKKKCVSFSVNALVLREICLKKGRS